VSYRVKRVFYHVIAHTPIFVLRYTIKGQSTSCLLGGLKENEEGFDFVHLFSYYTTK